MSELVVTWTPYFEDDFLWKDQGSRAPTDIAFWRPFPPDLNSYILGDYLQLNYDRPNPLPPGYTNPTTSSSDFTEQMVNRPPVNFSVYAACVSEGADDGKPPSIAPPTGFIEVWRDTGTGSDYDGTIWKLNPPPGYLSLGCAATRGHGTPPPVDKFRCIRADLLTKNGECPKGPLLWNDSNGYPNWGLFLNYILPMGNGPSLNTFYAYGKDGMNNWCVYYIKQLMKAQP